ncbi:MAG: hypothetical protein IJU48_03640 [Synergistaceae bacterium]|nr:hypothetical protein [Synergistaceae bacterium]
MKIFINKIERVIFFCIIFLALASSSFAEIQEFKYFSVDVPEYWTAQEKDNEVRITANDKTGELVIIASEPEEKTIAEIASEFSAKFGSSELVSDDEGTFTFEFSDGEGQATITGDENFYMVIMASGFEKNGDTLGEILNSLEMK